MKVNMGTTDRIVRVLIAIMFSILYFTETVTGTLAYILLALGGVFLLTSFVSFCPLYRPFKISTKKEEK